MLDIPKKGKKQRIGKYIAVSFYVMAGGATTYLQTASYKEKRTERNAMAETSIIWSTHKIFVAKPSENLRILINNKLWIQAIPI